MLTCWRCNESRRCRRVIATMVALLLLLTACGGDSPANSRAEGRGEADQGAHPVVDGTDGSGSGQGRTLPPDSHPQTITAPDPRDVAEFDLALDLWWMPMGRSSISLPRGNPISAMGITSWGMVAENTNELDRVLRVWNSEGKFGVLPVSSTEDLARATWEELDSNLHTSDTRAARFRRLTDPMHGRAQSFPVELQTTLARHGGWESLSLFEADHECRIIPLAPFPEWCRFYREVAVGQVAKLRFRSADRRRAFLRSLSTEGATVVAAGVEFGEVPTVARIERVVAVSRLGSK